MPPWRKLVPLAAATAATQASMVVIAPIVVRIGDDLDASVGQVGQARTINALCAVAATLAIGPLIDRLGVRPLLLWGGLIAMAGSVASAAAPSLGALYGAQAIVGVGVAAMLTAGFAGVAASFPRSERVWAMGYVIASQSVAWLLGVPLIGILAEAGSWRLSFAVPVAACAITVIAGLASSFPRTFADPGGAPSGGLLTVIRHRSARNWTLAEAVAYAAWTSEITYIGAFYAKEYGLQPARIGLLMAAGSAVFAVTTLATANLLRRAPRRAVIGAAALGMAAVLPIGFNVTPAVGFTLATFCAMAFFAGLRSTASSSLGLAQLPDQPGSMMASRTGSAQLGYIVGAGAGGALIDARGFGTLGIVLGAVMAASALLVARVEDPGMEPEPDRMPEAVD